MQNFKQSEPVNALLDDDQAVKKVKLNPNDSQDEIEPENTNLLQRINSETNLQVTGKVKGVLKKLNKTYGGSIISENDMLVSTLNKFKSFCENHEISKENR